MDQILNVLEAPIGSGKTQWFVDHCKKINREENSQITTNNLNEVLTKRKIVYVGQTKELCKQTAKDIGLIQHVDYEVINSDEGSVKAKLLENYSYLNEIPILFITHSAMYRYGMLDLFKNRHWYIDELPVDLFSFKRFTLSKKRGDYGLLNLGDTEQSKRDYANQCLSNIDAGHSDESQDLHDFYTSLAHGLYEYKVKGIVDKNNKEAHEITYARIGDPSIFENAASITVMAGRFRDTLVELYFKKIANMSINYLDHDLTNNHIKNPTTIYPLINVTNKKFRRLTKTLIDENINVMKSKGTKFFKEKSTLCMTNKRHEKLFDTDFDWISPSSKGSNSYQHISNAFVVYSANLDNALKPVMQCVCDKFSISYSQMKHNYEIQQTVDVVQQFVMRTVLRSHKDLTTPVSLMVGDTVIAKDLQDMICNSVISYECCDDLVGRDPGTGNKNGNKNGSGNKGKGCELTQFFMNKGLNYQKSKKLRDKILKQHQIQPCTLINNYKLSMDIMCEEYLRSADLRLVNIQLQ